MLQIQPIYITTYCLMPLNTHPFFSFHSTTLSEHILVCLFVVLKIAVQMCLTVKMTKPLHHKNIHNVSLV